MRKGKLGQMLAEAKRISPDQLQKASDMQKILGGKLGTIIVKLGFISDEELTKFLAKQESLPIADLSQLVLPEGLVQRVPKDVLVKHQVIPIRAKGDLLTLAVSDPTDYEAIEEVQWLANCRVEMAMASRAQIAKALNDLFYREETPPAQEGGLEERGEDPEAAPEVGPALEKALIPLLLEKGIITLEELEAMARSMERTGRL